MTESMREPAEVRRSTRRWQMAAIWVLLALVLSFPLYKMTEGSRLEAARASQRSAQLAAAGQLWSLNCAECHGKTGQGVDAPALNAKEFLASVSDQQIRGIIAGGVPGTAMPAWLSDYGGPLTEQQIEAMVVYLRSWEANAPSRPDWRTVGGG
jgi:mono/diheme cytochrome c family protein